MSTHETRYAASEKLRPLYFQLAKWALLHGEIEEDPSYKVLGSYDDTLVVEDYPPVASSALDPGAIHRHAWEFSDRFEVGDKLELGYTLPHYRHYNLDGPQLIAPNGPPKYFEPASLILRINKHHASALSTENIQIRDAGNILEVDRTITARIPNSDRVKHHDITAAPQGGPGSITLREFVGLAALSDALQLHEPSLLKPTTN